MFPIRSLALLVGLQVLGCSVPAQQESPAPDPVDAPAVDEMAEAADLPDEVFDNLVHGVPTRIVVHLGVDPVPEHPMSDPRRLAKFVERWPGVVEDFEGSLPGTAWVERSYRNIPVVVLEVEDLDSAYAVLDHPDVVAMDADLVYEMTDASALSHIRQPQAAAQGFTGEGTSIVIMDTGLNYKHSDFGCTSVGTPASCPVVAMRDLAREDRKLDADGHGSNVAAISLSVAPDADLIGLDVFDGQGASLTDILEALDWSVDNQATYNIASINMSLGLNMGNTSPCTTSPFEAGIAAAKAAGMSVVVAAGNDYLKNVVASPACAPSAFSVGAVVDTTYPGRDCTGANMQADLVACFSNSAYFLDILAPGYMVTGGGYTMSGTSMAAPHVAGAVAVLRAADPNATVNQLQQRLKDTGVQVTDRRNGLTFPRLDLAAAVDGVGCSFRVDPSSIEIDPLGESGSISVTTDPGCDFTVRSSENWLSVTPTAGDRTTSLQWTALPNAGFERSATIEIGPLSVSALQTAGVGASGGILVNDGDELTNRPIVNLTLNAPGSDRMCLSNEEDSCRLWYPYAETARWRLPGRTTGEYTVYAWFSANNVVSGPTSDAIVLDRRAPTGGELTTEGAIAGPTLRWGGFEDDYSGVASYIVVQSDNVRRAPGTACRTGTVVYEGTDESLFLPGLDGQFAFRVCPVDGAGNVGAGLTSTFETRPEYDPPEATIAIEDGRDWFNSTRANVTIEATDASGIGKVCLSSSSAACGRFIPFRTPIRVNLRGAGEHTVYAWVQDVHGNTMGPISDSISIEWRRPRDGSVTAETADQSVTLSLSGFSDDDSGLAGYRVMGSTRGWPQAGCLRGDVYYEGPETTITLDGLTNGEAQRLRVCAVDRAGNTSAGVTGEARPLPEKDGPLGSIVLAGGADYTRTPAIEATLSATDASEITHVCVTTRLPCGRFVPYTTTYPIAARALENTVYAVFRDEWGNESEPVSDTIWLDKLAPTGGAVTAERGDEQITLNFSDFSDNLSGIGGYSVIMVDGTRPPRSCRLEPTWTGTTTTVTFDGLTNGEHYSFLVCATDAVGNAARSGVSGTWRPAPELTRPTGSVTINHGDEWSRSRRVDLTIDATDESGLSRMCIDTRGLDTCSAWIPFAADFTTTIYSRDNPAAVRVWLEDVWGNQSATYLEDTIAIDYLRPADGTLAVQVSGTSANLSWSGFADEEGGSGLVSYTVVGRTRRAPGNCRAGEVFYEGSDTSTSISGLPANSAYGFIVCANDLAGNQSRGVGTVVTTGN